MNIRNFSLLLVSVLVSCASSSTVPQAQGSQDFYTFNRVLACPETSTKETFINAVGQYAQESLNSNTNDPAFEKLNVLLHCPNANDIIRSFDSNDSANMIRRSRRGENDRIPEALKKAFIIKQKEFIFGSIQEDLDDLLMSCKRNINSVLSALTNNQFTDICKNGSCTSGDIDAIRSKIMLDISVSGVANPPPSKYCNHYLLKDKIESVMDRIKTKVGDSRLPLSSIVSDLRTGLGTEQTQMTTSAKSESAIKNQEMRSRIEAILSQIDEINTARQ